jgi:hypothetical protein
MSWRHGIVPVAGIDLLPSRFAVVFLKNLKGLGEKCRQPFRGSKERVHNLRVQDGCTRIRKSIDESIGAVVAVDLITKVDVGRLNDSRFGLCNRPADGNEQTHRAKLA